jgi:hypothetical protein
MIKTFISDSAEKIDKEVNDYAKLHRLKIKHTSCTNSGFSGGILVLVVTFEKIVGGDKIYNYNDVVGFAKYYHKNPHKAINIALLDFNQEKLIKTTEKIGSEL